MRIEIEAPSAASFQQVIEWARERAGQDQDPRDGILRRMEEDHDRLWREKNPDADFDDRPRFQRDQFARGKSVSLEEVDRPGWRLRIVYDD